MYARTLTLSIISFILGTISIGVAYAWSEPTGNPTTGDVDAPINVGPVDQVKDGGIGVNSLAVFGNSLFGGAAGSNAYLNFGATSGQSGYGIRDNDGILEFKNDGGSWESMQNVVYDLTGGGDSHLSNVVYATSGTDVAYVPSPGTSYIEVEIWGGGGGGGRGWGPAGTIYYGGTGGSSGGYAYKVIQSPGAMYYTIGSGGAGSTAANVLGSTGGTTCFGTNSIACTSPTMSATGGGGGGSPNQTPGAPGSGSGGDVNISGGGGSAGGTTQNIGVPGGSGGPAPRGGGGGYIGRGGCASGSLCNGGDGAAPGGGGGGGGNNVGYGGAAASGGILIKEY